MVTRLEGNICVFFLEDLCLDKLCTKAVAKLHLKTWVGRTEGKSNNFTMMAHFALISK